MNPRTVRRALIAGVLLMLAPTGSMAQPRGVVTVFAAASLKNALDDVGAAFKARTGKGVRFSYGASSALAREIEAGAPANVFVSADVDWMDYVAARGLIVAASRRDLLTNHLALIAPADSKVRLRIGKGMPLAAALGDGRLALAAPEVPAGKYAQASLTALNVWDSVSAKLAPAVNVRAALLFVARGETPLGIVYDTDAKVEPRVKIVGPFPDWSHPPIIYPAALVSHHDSPDARSFMAFLSGPQAKAIFRRFDFVVLGPRR
ncbi:MAG TPA: molybdate ABC transporter substrate-binding protein [Caulobacteraceae bacterium]|nr:molybdate ABC transporter substrate-binding protein [Caulobacteraceae bacterium]